MVTRRLDADVLQFADPSMHSLDRVTEAFRSYEPAGQRRAMAALLVGLWRYAGLPTLDGGAVQPPARARHAGRLSSVWPFVVGQRWFLCR